MYHSHNGFYDSECKGFFFRICDVSSHHIFLQCFSNQRYCWWKTCFPHFLLTHFTVFILHPVLFPRPLYQISIGGVAALGNQNANSSLLMVWTTSSRFAGDHESVHISYFIYSEYLWWKKKEQYLQCKYSVTSKSSEVLLVEDYKSIASM